MKKNIVLLKNRLKYLPKANVRSIKFQKTCLGRKKLNNINESIVLIGGGGGVYRVAKPLKDKRLNITTIQTTFDNGGHSRILRDEFGVLPPGDIRQAILALSDDEKDPFLRELLSYRFASDKGSSLDSASVGNILITALTKISGSMIIAINTLCRWFGVKGKVLPVSLDSAELCVKLSDGSILRGEGLIDTRIISDNRTIVSAFLEPDAYLYTGADEAIRSADKIVFCPGDLYTSIVPNTLVQGFKEAIKESRGKLIYVVNIMNKKSETNQFTASRFAETMLHCIGRKSFDVIICNTGVPSKVATEAYEKEGSFLVEIDEEKLAHLADNIIKKNLLDETGGIIRHSGIIASIIAGI